MRPINTIAIRQQVKHLTRPELKRWVEGEIGKPISEAELDSLLRDRLPKEAEYQAKILEWIKEEYPDAFVWKAAAGPYSQVGIPDICAIINGRFYGFEVKRPCLGKLHPMQALALKRIKEAGGFGGVVSFPADALWIITEAENGHQAKATEMAVWKDHNVIGYVQLTTEQADSFNRMKGLGVYFGFDQATAPEKYVEAENHG